jgi:Co/Zn/Cd efflux system component
MSAHCCPRADSARNARFRRVLWIALAVNTAVFAVELIASAWSGSSALGADAADFLGDAANYALSLGAIAAGGAWVSRAALAKGWAMAACGGAVLAYAAWRVWLGIPPEPVTMGAIGAAALAANAGVAILLYAHRDGDANMRSAWLCTRNDVIGNLAVLAAAASVFGTGSVWPDVAVAMIMASIALSASLRVIAQSRAELQSRPG